MALCSRKVSGAFEKQNPGHSYFRVRTSMMLKGLGAPRTFKVLNDPFVIS